MSKEFIEAGYNKSDLTEAARQESQLSYFTQSSLQDEKLSSEYLKEWANRKYQTNDYFLNYVKSVFKTENFLSFFKYMRKPLPSAKLINNKIKPQLNRVFVAENSDFKYDVTNVDIAEIKETLDVKKFQDTLLNKLLFKHNSISITDLEDDKVNSPYRYFVDIKDVLSLEYDADKDEIKKIAYNAIVAGELVIVYIDDKRYSVYNTEKVPLLDFPHDLGRCPAHFISKDAYKDKPVIRESIFTYVREELEEYVFLKTLQKMTEPNGAIPITVKMLTDDGDESEDFRGEIAEPGTYDSMSSQRAGVLGDNNNNTSGDLQAGTIHEVEPSLDNNNQINMDVVDKYFKFFYIPVEALNYLKTRIAEVENSIISTVIGTIDSSNEESKNEMQIEKSIIVLENTLIYLADNLNRIRRESDYDTLALKYGKERVNEVFIFYGTDFFLESTSKLFDDFEKAQNPIERKNILVQINQNKYKNNPDQRVRQKLLYDLLPFTSDKDFEVARTLGLDNLTAQYQLRFNYWIGMFEASYGDIVSFYSNLDSDSATKLIVINNLITEIIKANTLPPAPEVQEGGTNDNNND